MPDIVILAAGKGSRIRSKTPKVLHVLGGKTILEHVLDVAENIVSCDRGKIFVVTGYCSQLVDPVVRKRGHQIVNQPEQLGTGHALFQALNQIHENTNVLVMCGDVPLIKSKSLLNLCEVSGDGISILTTQVDDPLGYGRVIRDSRGSISEIVEEIDASCEHRKIKEINTGFYCAKVKTWGKLLPNIVRSKQTGELYLTDCIKLAYMKTIPIVALNGSKNHILGVNTRQQLSMLENLYQINKRKELLDAGVTLLAPETLYIFGEISVGMDSIIEPNVMFLGKVSIGESCIIETGCRIEDSVIGDEVTILSHSRLESAKISSQACIGPYARLRPGSKILEGAKIGNFVEIKSTEIGEKSKINHLSYIGDSVVGKRVNVGAGVITCNYDGSSKHATKIKDDAFVGSNSSLVAPITVGEKSTIGAGSTITKDVENGYLSVARCRQREIPKFRNKK